MEISILVLPLLASIIAGFFGKLIGDRNSEIVTSLLVTISAILSTIVFYNVIINQYQENIIIAVDQEGGRVKRYKNEFSLIPSMQVISLYAKQNNDMEIFTDLAWLISSELIAVGIDINFAPVVDVDEKTSSIIGDRVF